MKRNKKTDDKTIFYVPIQRLKGLGFFNGRSVHECKVVTKSMKLRRVWLCIQSNCSIGGLKNEAPPEPNLT